MLHGLFSDGGNVNEKKVLFLIGIPGKQGDGNEFHYSVTIVRT